MRNQYHKYLLIKSAGDNPGVVTTRMPAGSDIGYPYEYAEKLAREITLAMKAQPVMLEALQVAETLISADIVRDDAGCLDKVRSAIALAKGEI